MPLAARLLVPTLWIAVCVPIETLETQRRAVGAELSPDEDKLARDLATPSVLVAFPTRGPIYIVAVERFRDKAAEERDSGARFAVVSHYRYEGDLTIRTVVDLSRRAVLRTDTAAHVPTPLAPEELARVRELALGDSLVRRALGQRANDVVVEGLVIHTTSHRDPLFGRRVVRVLFRVGPNYVRRPIVSVDLTRGLVVIEQSGRDPR